MFGTMPYGGLMVGYRGQPSNAGLSPRIWTKFNQQLASPDGFPGFVCGDNFCTGVGFTAASGAVVVPTPGTATIDSATGDYYCYADTAAVISRVATAAGGVIRLSTDVDGTNDDNDMCAINSGVLGEISRTSGEQALTAFECRFRLPSQVTSGSVAIGLGATAIAADGGQIVDTGEIITTGGDFIGIRTLDADPDGFDIAYKVSGTAGSTVVSDAAKVLAADTWCKFGFVYDPAAPATKRITFYFDNTEHETYVTDTNMAAATFPNSVMLGFLASIKADGTTVTRNLDIDWWAFGQELL